MFDRVLTATPGSSVFPKRKGLQLLITTSFNQLNCHKWFVFMRNARYFLLNQDVQIF